MPEAFLDSTVLIDLAFRHAMVGARAAAALSAKGSRITSRYVIFEIARGYFRNLLLLHNKSKAVNRFSELHEYVHSGQQIYRRYQSGTMLGAFDDYFAYLEALDGRCASEELLAEFRGWLSAHVRRGWKRLLNTADTINQVGCRPSLPEPTRRADGCYEQELVIEDCGKPDRCGLDHSLVRHHAEFEHVRQQLSKEDEIDNETHRRVQALGRLLQRASGTPFNGQDCYDCGDAFICHEAPKGSTVVSKNEKHFAPLCAALGKQLASYR